MHCNSIHFYSTFSIDDLGQVFIFLITKNSSHIQLAELIGIVKDNLNNLHKLENIVLLSDNTSVEF